VSNTKKKREEKCLKNQLQFNSIIRWNLFINSFSKRNLYKCKYARESQFVANEISKSLFSVSKYPKSLSVVFTFHSDFILFIKICLKQLVFLCK